MNHYSDCRWSVSFHSSVITEHAMPLMVVSMYVWVYSVVKNRIIITCISLLYLRDYVIIFTLCSSLAINNTEYNNVAVYIVDDNKTIERHWKDWFVD